MKQAIISDIHGNLEALRMVLEEIRQQGIPETLCLGDIIGYGPNPVECVDLVMKHCRLSILGNHDQAAIFDPENFNAVAMEAIYWTRDQLEDRRGGVAAANRRWDFLGELPRKFKDGDYLYVHGSPRDPTNEYVFPEDVYNQQKMEALFRCFERYCFTGHTHLPGVMTQAPKYLMPEEFNHRYRLDDEKVIINVGSVGQPRDSDPRACYVVLDVEEGTVQFNRVEYPCDETASKIHNIPQLNNRLGDRLRSGD